MVEKKIPCRFPAFDDDTGVKLQTEKRNLFSGNQEFIQINHNRHAADGSKTPVMERQQRDHQKDYQKESAYPEYVKETNMESKPNLKPKHTSAMKSQNTMRLEKRPKRHSAMFDNSSFVMSQTKTSRPKPYPRKKRTITDPILNSVQEDKLENAKLNHRENTMVTHTASAKNSSLKKNKPLFNTNTPKSKQNGIEGLNRDYPVAKKPKFTSTGEHTMQLPPQRQKHTSRFQPKYIPASQLQEKRGEDVTNQEILRAMKKSRNGYLLLDEEEFEVPFQVKEHEDEPTVKKFNKQLAKNHADQETGRHQYQEENLELETFETSDQETKKNKH